jgi:hypothetical protein
MKRALAEFTITRSGDGYQLRIVDDAGEPIELTATFEQLDVMIEALDEALDSDEEEILSADRAS